MSITLSNLAAKLQKKIHMRKSLAHFMSIFWDFAEIPLLPSENPNPAQKRLHFAFFICIFAADFEKQGYNYSENNSIIAIILNQKNIKNNW